MMGFVVDLDAEGFGAFHVCVFGSFDVREVFCGEWCNEKRW